MTWWHIAPRSGATTRGVFHDERLVDHMLSILTLLSILVSGALALLASGSLLGVIAGVGACRERPVALQTAFAALCTVIAMLAWSYVVVTM